MKKDFINIFFVFLTIVLIILNILNYYSPKAHSDWKDFTIAIVLLIWCLYYYYSDRKKRFEKN